MFLRNGGRGEKEEFSKTEGRSGSRSPPKKRRERMNTSLRFLIWDWKDSRKTPTLRGGVRFKIKRG